MFVVLAQKQNKMKNHKKAGSENLHYHHHDDGRHDSIQHQQHLTVPFPLISLEKVYTRRIRKAEDLPAGRQLTCNQSDPPQ